MLQRPCVAVQELKLQAYTWPLYFGQGNWLSLQTADDGPQWALYCFPMTSLLMGPQGAVNQILSEASLSPSLPSSLPHTHTHKNTHAELLHRYDLTTTTFQVSPCCPPSPSKALTHCLFSTLSALTPHAATPLSGTHCLTLRAFQQGDELTAAAMRSAASWLQPSASHWSQQSVSILHPLQLAHAIIAGQRITGEAVDVSGWSQV